MRPHSFFSRLFAGTLLLVAAIVTLGALVSYGYLDREFRRRGQEYQENLTGVLRQHFQRTWGQDPQQTQRDCRDLLRGMTDRLTVIAADGRVLADSEFDPVAMVNHKTPDRPEVLAALQGRSGQDVRSSGTAGVEFSYLALPVFQGGQVVGVVRLAMPVQAIQEGGTFIAHALLWSALTAIAAAGGLGLLISWLWARPLRLITAAARQIASGDLSARARLFGSREMDQLAAALNEMRSSLAGQIELIAAQRENLQAVVSHLREGVIALDAAGRVVLMNQAAVEILAPASPQPEGLHIQAAARIPEMSQVLGELSAGKVVTRQIEAEIKGRHVVLQLHAESVKGPPDGIAALIVARDVSDLVRTAAMKAEFVANASHELRTPLATIRAAVDSLSVADPGDLESHRKCLEILDRQVRRLEGMTNDLLDLHLVEQGKQQLNLEEIGLDQLARWAQGYFASQAAERNVALTVRAQPPEFRLQSDRRLVQLILQNLLDNGLKFTPAGGKVDCLLERKESSLLLRVCDTGVGIPADLQPRVFERFFQADPSRSGPNRGTGLGLAIVKYAAERLGGQVNLESRVGLGTTVSILLPACAAGSLGSFG